MELSHSSSESYSFTHIDPVEHLSVLQALALEPEAINDAWLQELDSVVRLGSIRLDPRALTPERLEIVKEARARFATMLGLDNPAHDLHKAFLKETGGDSFIPDAICRSFRTLSEVMGNPLAAKDAIQRTHKLLIKNPKEVQLRVNFLQRMIEQNNWKGDIHELLREHPTSLLLSSSKLLALGQLAVAYPLQNKSQTPTKQIKAFFSNIAMESRLLAMLKDDPSVPKRHVIYAHTNGARLSDLRESIYELIADPKTLQKVGTRAIKAYFLYRPPSASAQLTYPHIQPFVAPKYRYDHEFGARAPITIDQQVVGNEHWISELENAPTARIRKSWLAEINTHVQLGSQDISGVPNEAAYERVLNHRLQFFLKLGWGDPENSLYPAYEKFVIDQDDCLIPPHQVVRLLNTLDSYGVTPIEHVIEQAFDLVACDQVAVEQELACLTREGYNVNSVMQRRPRAFLRKVKAAEARIRRSKQAS